LGPTGDCVVQACVSVGVAVGEDPCECEAWSLADMPELISEGEDGCACEDCVCVRMKLSADMEDGGPILPRVIKDYAFRRIHYADSILTTRFVAYTMPTPSSRTSGTRITRRVTCRGRACPLTLSPVAP
jgi:hypothetical protein